MSQPTKSGIYWFIGEFTDRRTGVEKHSAPVKVDFTHGDGPEVFFLGWDISEDLESFKGKWIELTEEKVKRL